MSTCEEARAANVALNRGLAPKSPIDELMIILHAPREGGRVEGFWIDYEVGDTAYSLPVHWTLLACGTDISDETCNA